VNDSTPAAAADRFVIALIQAALPVPPA
jgi:hypothetical protein